MENQWKFELLWAKNVYWGQNVHNQNSNETLLLDHYWFILVYIFSIFIIIEKSKRVLKAENFIDGK
jgi:hypothetical protein